MIRIRGDFQITSRIRRCGNGGVYLLHILIVLLIEYTLSFFPLCVKRKIYIAHGINGKIPLLGQSRVFIPALESITCFRGRHGF